MLKDIQNRTTCKPLPLVGLSYCSQSHRFLIDLQIHQNGECKVKSKRIVRKHYKDLLTESFNLPKREGPIFQNGLTNKAKGKIKLASRIFQHKVLLKHSKKAYASFITLTYGKDYPTDHQAKKHLDNFFKRLKRQYPELQYIWVAENQKRGAIHFHILTPNYIPKDLINKAWNGIVSKWQKGEGFNRQEVYPHVGKVWEAGKYMTKYMQKEGENIGGNMYGIDYKTRSEMKADRIVFEGPKDLNEIAVQLSETIKSRGLKDISYPNTDYFGNHQEWISRINEFNLKEFIKYKVPELNLKVYGIQTTISKRQKGIPDNTERPEEKRTVYCLPNTFRVQAAKRLLQGYRYTPA